MPFIVTFEETVVLPESVVTPVTPSDAALTTLSVALITNVPESKFTLPDTAVPDEVTFTRPPARDVLPPDVKIPPTDPFPATEIRPERPRLVALTILLVPFIMRVPESKFTLPEIA